MSYAVFPPTRTFMFPYQREQFRRLRGSEAVWWTLPDSVHGEPLLTVCADVALPSFLEVRCAGAADWTAIHAAMIVVTNPGKRNATSAVKK